VMIYTGFKTCEARVRELEIVLISTNSVNFIGKIKNELK
jgi:hypothetical protein